MTFVPQSQINNIPALIQITPWHRSGDKPLSEPIMAQFTNAHMRQSVSMNELSL